MQMASAARLAATFPQVGEELRSRYRVVLLDEYQDTGHAQRVALSALFGGGVDDGLALTAVGDPIQSIYGWRGASATNLPRFTTDFPRSDGTPAPILELRTSWRNPPRTLRVANAVSAEARRRSVAVHALRPRPDAPPGTVRCALLTDVTAEREWIADHLDAHYRRARDDGVSPPTAAVLVRRNADAAPIADALRARGIPVEVVGLAGLLSIPEVAEVVAMLRLVADPTAGAAAMRVLTGPRWRLGARDIAALWRRARRARRRRCRRPTRPRPSRSRWRPAPTPTPHAWPTRSPIPGRPGRIRLPGYQRITALAAELSALRGHLGHPLPDLVAEVRRVLGVDCEVRAAAAVAAGWAGTEHLDAFADVVAGYAERTATRPRTDASASVAGLLAYLDVAETVENGLAPAPLTVARDRVQVLTVHSAKGLEWQVVAVAHLSGGTFPSTASRSSWLTDAAELPPLLRGDRAAAGALGIPVMDTSDVTNRKQLSDKISEHRRQLEQRRIDEERRLLYVAHHAGRGHPAGVRAPLGGHRHQTARSVGLPMRNQGQSSTIRPRPATLAEWWNSGRPHPPTVNETRYATTSSKRYGRADPLARAARRRRAWRRAGEAGAGRPTRPRRGVDVDGWAADVDALLAERARVGAAGAPRPARPVVGQLPGRAGARPGGRRAAVDAPVACPTGAACVAGQCLSRMGSAILRRRVAVRSWRSAWRGGFRSRRRRGMAALQDAFSESPWAARTPVAVEVPFEMPIGDTLVRGRIDAVFADPDGGATVVDWKTGEPPRGPEAMRQAAVQLAVYRLAWAALAGVPESSVRTAFYYVRARTTVIPEELPSDAEVAGLLIDPDGDRRVQV